MPTTIPAMVPTGVPPPFEEGATVTVADDDGVFDPDDAGVVVVEDGVDELAVLGAAVVAEEDAVVEASLMLK